MRTFGKKLEGIMQKMSVVEAWKGKDISYKNKIYKVHGLYDGRVYLDDSSHSYQEYPDYTRKYTTITEAEFLELIEKETKNK